MNNLAFDKSARYIDADGRLHVTRSNISKATINPYYGNEIPDFERLGLQPDRVYNLLRDPEELAKGLATFARLPILSKHVPVSAQDSKKDLVIGAIGSDVSFDSPYLVADLCFWDADAIRNIESDAIRELSCAYRYVPVMEPGIFEGRNYDGIMTQIVGNHLALVEVGRAGSDVLVADSNPFHKETLKMKLSELAEKLLARFGALSPKLAQDAALKDRLALVNEKTDKQAVKSVVLASDEDIDPQQLDNVIDAVLGVEQSPEPMEMMPAKDDGMESKHAEIINYLRNCGLTPEQLEGVGNMLTRMDEPQAPEAMDNYDNDMKENKMEDMKGAMDAKLAEFKEQLRKDLKAAEDAKRDVLQTVGHVAMDSAGDIYRFALKHCGVETKVNDVDALKQMFALARNSRKEPVSIAQDSAKTAAIFPGLSRFKNI